MFTNAIGAHGPADTNAVASAATQAAGNAKPDDKNMFITLLVAQLKNQDPLAPQDSTQFLAQLAQFNSLEQLMSINQRIGQLLDSVAAAAVSESPSAERVRGAEATEK